MEEVIRLLVMVEGSSAGDWGESSPASRWPWWWPEVMAGGFSWRWRGRRRSEEER